MDVSKEDKLKSWNGALRKLIGYWKKKKDGEKQYKIEQDIAMFSTDEKVLKESTILTSQWFNLLVAMVNKYYKRIPVLILIFLL